MKRYEPRRGEWPVRESAKGRYVRYEDASKEIKRLKVKIKELKDKASFDNAWDGY